MAAKLEGEGRRYAHQERQKCRPYLGEGRRYAHQERQKCRPYLATDSALHMLGGGPMGKIVLAESTGQSSSPGSWHPGETCEERSMGKLMDSEQQAGGTTAFTED